MPPNAALNTICIPALQSNYFWLVQPNAADPLAYVFDPGDGKPIMAALKSHRLHPAAILITHHHHDHVNGIAHLREHYPQIPVYGPPNPAIPLLSHPLAAGETLQLNQFTLEVLPLPGHTPDHIGYLHRPDSGPWLVFSGDTLFSAGCGRLLGGTAEDLYHSLQGLAALPEDTLVYASHEYTLDNLNFALAVEPDNLEARAYRDNVQQRRTQGEPSLPTSIGLEQRINPFLRVHLPQIRASVEAQVGKNLGSGVEVFAALRRWKDQFSS